MSGIHVEHDPAHEIRLVFTDPAGGLHVEDSKGWKATSPEFPDLVMYGDTPEKARGNMEWRIRVEVVRQEFML